MQINLNLFSILNLFHHPFGKVYLAVGKFMVQFYLHNLCSRLARSRCLTLCSNVHSRCLNLHKILVSKVCTGLRYLEFTNIHRHS